MEKLNLPSPSSDAAGNLIEIMAVAIVEGPLGDNGFPLVPISENLKRVKLPRARKQARRAYEALAPYADFQ